MTIMKDFMEKLQVYTDAKDAIESHIENVFDKYIEVKSRRMRMDSWEIESDSIAFSGDDGAYNYPDPEYLEIPMMFFVDEGKAFDEELEKKRLENERKELERIARKEFREIHAREDRMKQYHELQKEFGDGG